MTTELQAIKDRLPKYTCIAPVAGEYTEQKGDILYADSSKPDEHISNLFILRPVPDEVLSSIAEIILENPDSLFAMFILCK